MLFFQAEDYTQRYVKRPTQGSADTGRSCVPVEERCSERFKGKTAITVYKLRSKCSTTTKTMRNNFSVANRPDAIITKFFWIYPEINQSKKRKPNNETTTLRKQLNQSGHCTLYDMPTALKWMLYRDGSWFAKSWAHFRGKKAKCRTHDKSKSCKGTS